MSAALHSGAMGLRLAVSAMCVALLMLASVAPADAGRARYYLSLGDSLAQGMQPDAAGLTVNTNQGYADQLYAIEKPKISGLQLVKLGCGGETTTSFLTGQGNSGDALLLGCDPTGGSQMAAAERFLRLHRHRGEVALVTLDIGANDVDGCESEDAIDTRCVIQGAAHIKNNLPVIMRRLRRAAARGTPMAAMTFYNPFLELYLTPGGQTEAIASDEYARNVNEGLARLYRASEFRVAHVDTAFHTYDISRKTNLAGQPHPVPVAVAEVCRLTWMCAPAPVGPNIHANNAGYRLIAQAFAKAFASR
jgi:lysophospholipase L1-like esterase